MTSRMGKFYGKATAAAREAGRWYERRDNRALAAALLFPVVGIVVVWLAGWMAGATSDAVLVTLLLGPVAIYLIGTQRLRELSGPGGIFSVKLAETVSARVRTGEQMIWPSGDEILQVQRGDLRSLQSVLPSDGAAKTIVLVLTAHVGAEPYNRRALQEYVHHLSRYRGFRLVVITDRNRGFQASVSPSALRDTLAGDQGQRFVERLNSGLDSIPVAEITALFPVLVTAFCTPEHTNAQVLALMRDLGLDVLAVVDSESHNLLGIVERDRIVTSILLAAETATATR